MAPSSEMSQFQPHVVAQLVPVKLTANNYLLWKSMLVPILMRYDMLNMVEGTEEKNPSALIEQHCMDFIKLTLTEAMLPHAVECSTPRALWLKLEAQGKIAHSCIVEMTSRLNKMEKASYMTMSDYYQSAKDIADGLATAGCPVSDADFVMHVLKGLPAEFDGFSDSIRFRSYTVTREELHELLVAEERERYNQLKRQVIKYAFVGLTCFIIAKRMK